MRYVLTYANADLPEGLETQNMLKNIIKAEDNPCFMVAYR